MMSLVYWFSYGIMKTLDWIYFRTKYVGRENFPKDGGFIIACNHISNLDPFVVGICERRRLSFLAKEELFKNKFLAFWFRGMGAYPVKRGKADLGAIKETLKRLKNGIPIILFPEGTRGTGSFSKKPQPGVGMIAVKSQVPVVPALILDTEKALPNGAKWFRRHPVKIFFGPAITFSSSKDYAEISSKFLRRFIILKI